LWQRFGLPPEEFTDPRFSPELVLALTGPALTGAVPKGKEPSGAASSGPASNGAEPFPEHYALVGPVLGARPAVPGFPWERLEPGRRRVLVTMGTLAAEVSTDFHARAVRALELLDGAGFGEVQAVIAAPPELLPPLPDGTVALGRVPVLELMAGGWLDAVLCHAGMNTVGEALSHGIPLALAPIRHDQPFVAAQVVAAGAGLRVPFARVSPDGLASALGRVLTDPGHRERAAAVGASLRAGGGARAAADRLEALVETEAETANELV
jgi:UDP:flavonoid glycosyltransferase YjiC (YdhE family)